MIRVVTQICVSGTVKLLQSAVVALRKWSVAVLYRKKMRAAGYSNFFKAFRCRTDCLYLLRLNSKEKIKKGRRCPVAGPPRPLSLAGGGRPASGTGEVNIWKVCLLKSTSYMVPSFLKLKLLTRLVL